MSITNILNFKSRNNSIEHYRQLRTVGTELNHNLFGQLSKTDMNNAGRLLGILHKGVLMFDEEGSGGVEISHFSDFAIFDYYNGNGLNAVQRHCEQHQNQLPELEDHFVKACLNAKSSLFSVIDVDQTNSTILLQDMFDDNYQVEIIDISMSKSPSIKNFFLFIRIISIDSINMTSGVSFVFHKEDEEFLKKKYKTMIKSTVAYTQQAKNYIVFLKLNKRYGVHTQYETIESEAN